MRFVPTPYGSRSAASPEASLGRLYLRWDFYARKQISDLGFLLERHMVFTLQNVVPWGRSYGEYVSMFALSENDLRSRILGCSDGPASFNSVLTKNGGCIVSVDPVYGFSPDEIKCRIDQTFSEIIEQTKKNRDEFVWTTISSVEELGRIRMDAMERFLGDFPAGFREGRYRDSSLPILPFKDKEFELALCSHFLFLYSQHVGIDFHLESLRELCRVSEEVRIFPLLELGAVTSRHLEPVKQRLAGEGFTVTIENVPYEFQKGGNRMMKISGPRSD
jgi:hypothetical protein